MEKYTYENFIRNSLNMNNKMLINIFNSVKIKYLNLEIQFMMENTVH